MSRGFGSIIYQFCVLLSDHQNQMNNLTFMHFPNTWYVCLLHFTCCQLRCVATPVMCFGVKHIIWWRCPQAFRTTFCKHCTPKPPLLKHHTWFWILCASLLLQWAPGLLLRFHYLYISVVGMWPPKGSVAWPCPVMPFLSFGPLYWKEHFWNHMTETVGLKCLSSHC